jgi:hypothetical protein
VIETEHIIHLISGLKSYSSLLGGCFGDLI